MRAVRVTAHGGLDAVECVEIDAPTPKPGEALIRVRASGMNHLDLWVRRGVEGHRFPLPLTLGSDGAGIVAEVGDGVSDVEVGDEVIVAPATSCGRCEACLSGNDPLCRHYEILGESCDGTSADFISVPTSSVFKKPSSMTWDEAACFTLSALTSWTMLNDKARLRPGETVLVLGGTSGVGSMAIQLAKWCGARVIATAGSEEKLALCAELGADECVHHHEESIPERVRAITKRRGVDIVFEHVGAATWESSVRSLARGGRLVTCGATTGAEVAIDLRALFFKNIALLGSTMGSRGAIPLLLRAYEAGAIRPVVGATLPIQDPQEAHRRLEAGEVQGKVVLRHD